VRKTARKGSVACQRSRQVAPSYFVFVWLSDNSRLAVLVLLVLLVVFVIIAIGSPSA
jgi:hypothetical protein